MGFQQLVDYSYHTTSSDNPLQVSIEDYNSSDVTTITIPELSSSDDELLSIELHRAVTLLLSFVLYNKTSINIKVIQDILTLSQPLSKDTSKWSYLTITESNQILNLAQGFLSTSLLSKKIYYTSYIIACTTIESKGLNVNKNFIDYENVIQRQLISTNMNISFSRDVIFCFNVLRAMLEQSRYNSSTKVSDDEKEALESLIEYYSTARRVIYTNTKLLEQEMNLYFLSSNSTSSCMNISNVECLLQDLIHVVDILYKKTCSRLSQPIEDNYSTESIYQQLQTLVTKLQSKIKIEYNTNKNLLSTFEQEQKAKMEAKQSKASQFEKKDNFDGMPEK